MQQAAAAALLQLIKGLNQSLQTYQNPELAHSEYGDAAAAAAEAAATGKPVPTDLTSCLNPLSQAGSSEVGSTGSGPGASWPLAGFREAAKTLAAVQAPMLDPSCPSSYPRLALPDLGPDAVWKLPAGALQGAVVDLTAVVASICLQVRLAGRLQLAEVVLLLSGKGCLARHHLEKAGLGDTWFWLA